MAAVPTREAALHILWQLNAGTSDGVIVGSRDPAVLAELSSAIRRGVAAVALQRSGDEPGVPVVRTEPGGARVLRRSLRRYPAASPAHVGCWR